MSQLLSWYNMLSQLFKQILNASDLHPNFFSYGQKKILDVREFRILLSPLIPALVVPHSGQYHVESLSHLEQFGQSKKNCFDPHFLLHMHLVTKYAQE